MMIIYDYPPNFDKIDKVFNVRGKPIFYAYGDKIFNPMRQHIPDAIIKHEGIHHKQQKEFGDIDGWWDEYIDNPEFRLVQEIEAHRAEFQYWIGASANAPKGFRSMKDFQLIHIAQRLASPLYGQLITAAEARKLILGQKDFVAR